MRSMQQQTNVIHTWQQQCNEKIVEIQEEVERVTGIIDPMHQNVHDIAASVERIKLEHVSFDLVEHMQKVEEDVHA